MIYIIFHFILNLFKALYYNTQIPRKYRAKLFSFPEKTTLICPGSSLNNSKLSEDKFIVSNSMAACFPVNNKRVNFFEISSMDLLHTESIFEYIEQLSSPVKIIFICFENVNLKKLIRKIEALPNFTNLDFSIRRPIKAPSRDKQVFDLFIRNFKYFSLLTNKLNLTFHSRSSSIFIIFFLLQYGTKKLEIIGLDGTSKYFDFKKYGWKVNIQKKNLQYKLHSTNNKLYGKLTVQEIIKILKKNKTLQINDSQNF